MKSGELAMAANSTIAAASSALKIRLFGPYSASIGDELLPKMRTRKEIWLLALLILSAVDRPVERSWLAGTLWPESVESAALFNLRRSLTFLRDVLGPQAERIQAPTARTLRIDMASADCDVLAFDTAVRQGTQASLVEAIELYRGPLLLGCTEDWVLEPRNSRTRNVMAALDSLVDKALESDDHAGAIVYLERVLELEPFRESALRALMTSLAALGRNAAATQHYRSYRSRVRREMNSEPGPETVALFHELEGRSRQGAPAPAAARNAAGGRGFESSNSDAAGNTNLPSVTSQLVGREPEIDGITAALYANRLVTLTGPGGVGKTRLSLAVAGSVIDQFPDGIWFVELAPLRDPKLTAMVVLACLGLRDQAGRSSAAALEAFIAEKKMLLIMDNCEHLVAAASDLVQTLLSQCPNLHVLATSRELLRAPAEWVWPIAGLPPIEARRLFQQRASEASFGFKPTEANVQAIEDVCRLLDGVPLAIEMAAARTRGMAVKQIAANMAHVFRLLNQRDSNLEERHQTLQATLQWSYDLLTNPERQLLEAVSVFQGGWHLDHAQDLCSEIDGLETTDVLDVLASLVDKSLVVFAEDQDGDGRYRLLKTVRQFAEQRLRLSGSEARLRRRHATNFLRLADASELPLQGEGQDRWITILTREIENFRAALAWCELDAACGSDGLLGVRMTRALLRFYLISGRVTEIRDWSRRSLAYSDGKLTANDRIWRTKLLADSGALAFAQADYSEARRYAEESIELYRADNNIGGIALATSTLGSIADRQGDYRRAQECYMFALAHWRAENNPVKISATLNDLSTAAYMLGDFDAARAMLSEALTRNREIGSPQMIAINLHNFGVFLQVQGNYAESRVFHEEALAIRRNSKELNGIAASLGSLGEVLGALGDPDAWKSMALEAIAIRRKTGDRLGIAMSLRDLGMIALGEGEIGKAREYFRDSLRVRNELTDQRGIALCLTSIAALALAEEPDSEASAVVAATLCGAVDSIFGTLGPGALSARQRSERQVLTDILTRALGETALSAALTQGRTLTRSEVVEMAIRV